MHKKLILEVFKSGRGKLIKNGLNQPSINSISEHIASFLTEDLKVSTNSRTLRNYYNKAKEAEVINISRIETINGLCRYLGFEDFESFISSKQQSDINFNKNEKKSSKKTYLFGIIFIVLVVTTVLILVRKDSAKFMIWKADHYEEVELDLKKYKLSDLKVYKQERINNFRKILPDRNYQFFNSDGSVRVWYGKNKNKDYEFFTDLGLHPETGKTLKPITRYIIKKYIDK